MGVTLAACLAAVLENAQARLEETACNRESPPTARLKSRCMNMGYASMLT